MNIAYAAAIPLSVFSSSHTDSVAMDFGRHTVGPIFGGVVIPLCVALSAIGAANGGLVAAGRLVYASAKEGHLPAILGRTHPKRNTFIHAIGFQGFLAIIMVIPGNFETLVNFFSFSAWVFYGSAVLGLLVMRWRKPGMARPFRVFLAVPIIFCIAAVYLILAPFGDAPLESGLSLLFTLLGIPVFYVMKWWQRRSQNQPMASAAWVKVEDEAL
eukprot:Colp12_sorted_trinity150504_noHs@35029